VSPYRYRRADHRNADADSRADVDADHRGADHRQDGRCGAIWGDPLSTPEYLSKTAGAETECGVKAVCVRVLARYTRCRPLRVLLEYP
jgi:hypothetical protein